MNERIKELAFEAGFTVTPCGLFEAEDTNLTHFAELVLQNYASQIMTTEERERFIREDEREANAKLLDDFAKTEMVPVKDTWRMGVMAAANAVRDKK